MTNGDRIRTFSNEQLALTLMCPVDACLTMDCEPIQIKKDNGKCNASQINECVKCIYKWLNQEETNENA